MAARASTGTRNAHWQSQWHTASDRASPPIRVSLPAWGILRQPPHRARATLSQFLANPVLHQRAALLGAEDDAPAVSGYRNTLL
jgi:hypothetical protein